VADAKLKQKIRDDLGQAMKSGDTVKRTALRMLLAAITNTEKARMASLEDGDILGVIAKEIKQHHESIDAFKLGKRQDLVDQEETELAILQGYMPEQMSREDVVAAVKKVVEEVGAQSLADKGKVMPKIIAQLKGKADGKEINEIVTEMLNS